MKLNIARVAALGPLGIGILFTALGNGACAAGSGEPSSGSEGVGKNTQATITPVSLNTDGACNAVGTFAITSPQVISFIAANASQFKNAQFQLFVQTQSGSTKTVASSMQSASAAFNNMLQAQASATAMTSASALQVASALATSSATTSATAHEDDTTTISGSQSQWAKADSTATHTDMSNASASGTAINLTASMATSANNALGTSGSGNTANNSFFTTALQQSTVPAFFGGIGLLPVSNSSSASQISSAAASNSAFFNNASGAAQQAMAANTSTFNTGSHTDNMTQDSTHLDSASGSQFSQTLTHELNASNSTLAANSNSNNTSLQASQNSLSTQNSGNSLTQSGWNNSNSATSVYNDLETMNSNTFLLVASLEASQASTILQLFQGSNNIVTGDQSFPINIPTCGN